MMYEVSENVDVELEGSVDFPCDLRYFYINGQEAEAEDFGEIIKTPTSGTRCKDIGFHSHRTGSYEYRTTLKKYNINGAEFDTICDILEDTFNFECCECFLGGLADAC